MANEGRIPVYFSHSYRRDDRPVNLFFWSLFWKAGFSFTVDPKSEQLSVPYLELMMRRSACFVAVVTTRDEPASYRCSPFIVHEYGLAVQAKKPRLVFVENGVAGSLFDLDDDVIGFNRQRLNNAKKDFVDRIGKLAEKSQPYVTMGDRPLKKAGLLLPRDAPAYVDNLDMIRQTLSDRGYLLEDVQMRFSNTFLLAKHLDQFDFIIADVSSPMLPSWIYPFIYGRFIPTIKLSHRHLVEAPSPSSLPLVGTGEALNIATASDQVILYWDSAEELESRLSQELDKLNRDRRQFESASDGTRYFRSLGRRSVPVFVSNANDANDLAGDLARALSLENMLYFHYRYHNTISLGSDWQGELAEKVNASAIFVALVTKGYPESPWCQKEYRIAQDLEASGKVTILPCLVEDPIGFDIEYQGIRLVGMPRRSQVSSVIKKLDQLMTGERDVPVRVRQPRSYAVNTPVDVAIITVLEEEYEAVLKHMRSHGRVLGTEQHPNVHSWEIGEIPSPDYSAPYRIVLSMAHHAGTTAGALAARNTVDAFDPLYVLLVGIAGGLGPIDKGDVVVSDRIWGYEYGKLDAGFKPRPDWNYPADSAIVSAARTLRARESEWSNLISEAAPEPTNAPAIIIGPVASGEKVVDDISDDFFQHVLNSWPKLRAVEMEGAGAASAILDARDRGGRVGFAMIRGISDIPRSGAGSWEQSVGGSTPQTQERDSWKKYAAAAAAVLSVQLIRRSWPRPPRSEESG
jgi:nucleoside phosphorylase